MNLMLTTLSAYIYEDNVIISVLSAQKDSADFYMTLSYITMDLMFYILHLKWNLGISKIVVIACFVCVFSSHSTMGGFQITVSNI